MQVTLIRHHHNQAELHDNAVSYLTRCGHTIVNRYPFDGDTLTPSDFNVTPTIILGGGQNVTELDQFPYLFDELKWISTCIRNEVPLLGICLGAQLIAHALGATVTSREPAECEYGFYPVYPTEYAGDWLPETHHFMQAHYQEFKLPQDAVPLAYSERYSQQAFRYGSCTYGVQFHPEVNKSIFLDWLEDTWSDTMAATYGAQSKAEQYKVANQHLDTQAQWFEQTLNTLFNTKS